jgi:hypothetical protein
MRNTYGWKGAIEIADNGFVLDTDTHGWKGAVEPIQSPFIPPPTGNPLWFACRDGYMNVEECIDGQVTLTETINGKVVIIEEINGWL